MTDRRRRRQAEGRVAPRRARPIADGGALVADVEAVAAAVRAGASPAAALGALRGAGPLRGVAAAVRLGRPLDAIALDVDTGAPAADLLVRSLAVVERAGAGAADAVDLALQALEEQRRLQRSIRVRTTQARAASRTLIAVPVVLAAVMAAAEPSSLGFYGTPVGAVTGLLAAALLLAGAWWSRRIVRGAEAAAVAADPLTAPPPADLRRRASAVLPPLAVLLASGGAPTLAVAAVAAGVGAVVLVDRRRPAAPDAGASAEADGGRPRARWSGGPPSAPTVALLAVAVEAGLPTASAVALVAVVGPPPARPALRAAARRLRSGWRPGEAFAGTGLARVGAVLDAAAIWGAPSGDALRRLADDLRAEVRAAVDEAAERVQARLVFPTTLLMTPAFLLGAVPPLVWSALRSSGVLGAIP